jgi:hypothetical protein
MQLVTLYLRTRWISYLPRRKLVFRVSVEQAGLANPGISCPVIINQPLRISQINITNNGHPNYNDLINNLFFLNRCPLFISRAYMQH